MKEHNLIPDLAKAQQAMAKKKEEAKLLKQDFLDLPVWKELASKYSFRLPPYYQPNTETKYLKRLFKHTGMDLPVYLEDCGVKSVKSLAKLNENWPAYAEVGLALEWINEQDLNKENMGV